MKASSRTKKWRKFITIAKSKLMIINQAYIIKPSQSLLQQMNSKNLKNYSIWELFLRKNLMQRKNRFLDYNKAV